MKTWLSSEMLLALCQYLGLLESEVMGNYHASFGGGRLETQVKLCAGRLPYLFRAYFIEDY